MAKRTMPTLPTSPEFERGRAEGIFATVQYATSYGKLCMDSDEMRTLADGLGVPVLLIETAQSHKHEDLDALTEWWAARQAVAR